MGKFGDIRLTFNKSCDELTRNDPYGFKCTYVTYYMGSNARMLHIIGFKCTYVTYYMGSNARMSHII